MSKTIAENATVDLRGARQEQADSQFAPSRASIVPMDIEPTVEATATRPIDSATPVEPRPLVSLVLPAYNEAAIVEHSLGILSRYMESLAHKYRWEILVINDGSRDETSALAKAFAKTRDNVFVLDHHVNFGLGQALKFAFNQCRGEVIVTMDMDLSYSTDHIERLVDTLRQTRAKIVIASPYLEGGKVENVPPLRKWMSVGANKLLSQATHGRVKTLTGMVRAYDAVFLRTLDFYSMGMEVNSEILYKAMVLRARVVEIPATLKWNDPPPQVAGKPARRSSMRIVYHMLTLLVAGFLYRPIMLFLIPGMMALALFGWCALWMLIDIAQAWKMVGFSHAAGFAWNQSPHTFVIGGLSLVAAIQLISHGVIALQNKCYFEQMFHLGTTTYRSSKDRESRDERDKDSRDSKERV